MNYTFKYSEIADLVFHLLAYLKVDNQSDLYSRAYIDAFDRLRTDGRSPSDEVAALSSYYNENFEKLAVINFLPFYAADLDTLEASLMCMPHFSESDKLRFLKPFMSILRREAEAYFTVRNSFISENSALIKRTEEYIRSAFDAFACFFAFTGRTSATLSLSHSLTRFGRGLGSGGELTAIVPCPVSDEGIPDAFFQLLHEYSHSVTDPHVAANIRMDDGTHMLAEYYVILFDHYLVKRVRPQDSEAYMRYALAMFDIHTDAPTEDMMLSTFPLSSELYRDMLQLVEAVSSAK